MCFFICGCTVSSIIKSIPFKTSPASCRYCCKRGLRDFFRSSGNLRIRCIAVQKRAVQFTKKPYLPLFSSDTAYKFAKDYAIKKSFRHALHLVTAHLPRQNQVAHALRTRDFWLASLSMHFPIHFGRRAHEYPVTLKAYNVHTMCSLIVTVTKVSPESLQCAYNVLLVTKVSLKSIIIQSCFNCYHASVPVKLHK